MFGEAPREGNRGGHDRFTWEEVKDSKHRMNYLGNSVYAPVGRWQKGKDLAWFTKEKHLPADVDDVVRKERDEAKRKEEEAMMAALGLPFKRPETATHSEEVNFQKDETAQDQHRSEKRSDSPKLERHRKFREEDSYRRETERRDRRERSRQREKHHRSRSPRRRRHRSRSIEKQSYRERKHRSPVRDRSRERRQRSRSYERRHRRNERDRY